MKKMFFIGLIMASAPLIANVSDQEFGNILRFQDLVNTAIDNNNYDLACKAQSEIYTLVKKANVRDMLQKAEDQKNAYCAVKKFSLLNK